jgi:predicted DsbA family dithiol-disulfide isomerase
MHIDIVFDVACPWCHIGTRRLDRALAQRPGLQVTRSWRPYRLNPDLPETGIPRALYLSAKFGGPRAAARSCAAIAAAGRAVGLRLAFERIERMPNTMRAHRLIRLAAADGCADSMVEALFAAYFRDGLDIGDGNVLAEIAARVGLDPDEARRYLAGDAGTAAVAADERRVRRLGIHAVPCFILEHGYAISGAQEPEMFLPLLDVAAGKSAPREVSGLLAEA